MNKCELTKDALFFTVNSYLLTW